MRTQLQEFSSKCRQKMENILYFLLFGILYNLNILGSYMFLGGNSNQVQKHKGKRTTGFSTRKQGQFSLGWDVSNQMNDFQVRKQQKEQSMATKVTSQRTSENIPGRQVTPMTMEEKCRELIEMYPDITTEQLHRRLALWESTNKQQIPRSSQKIETRVAPIKPTESAKNAIYGGQVETYTNQAKVSKRNEGTLSLGDGYNYFKDESNQNHKR